tara:strand:- start:8362 stop:8694 length:333 start_codon:yes stop_codon:yes gene_type:complete
MMTLELLGMVGNIGLPMVITLALPWLIKLLRAKLNNEQELTLSHIAEGAYFAVEKMARKSDNKIDDKVAEALKIISEELGRNPKPKEKNIILRAIGVFHEKKKGSVWAGK